VVKYLIYNYGWEKMQNLMVVFKEGSTYDKALTKIYGFDTNGLDSAWSLSLK
jgi:hypothetical protein